MTLGAVEVAREWERSWFSSFDEEPVPDTGFGTLDEVLWKPLLTAGEAQIPEVALQRLGLLTDDYSGVQRATVAGVLLCTRMPEQWLPQAGINATCYRGRHRAPGRLDAEEITGPLGRQIVDALAFVTRNMRVAAGKDRGRADLPQYSEEAVFDAIVNAVVHRDYSVRSRRIRLSMFEDRLEIQSPGALPDNLTVASMSELQVTRNEALTSVLERMPVPGRQDSSDQGYFMARRGNGVPIIRRRTEALSGKPPTYKLIDESELRLTIPSAIRGPSPARTPIPKGVGATKAGAAVPGTLNLLGLGGGEA